MIAAQPRSTIADKSDLNVIVPERQRSNRVTEERENQGHHAPAFQRDIKAFKAEKVRDYAEKSSGVYECHLASGR